MAKKKKAVKSKSQQRREATQKNMFVEAKTMPAAKVKYTIDLLKAIASGKKSGLIFISEMSEAKSKTSMHIEGVMYMQNISQLDVARTLLNNDSLNVKALIEAMREKIMGETSIAPHKHDKNGDCIL